MVFLFEKIVIKVPKLKSWLSFVLGILENLHERYWWNGRVSADKWYSGCGKNLAQIYWADRFGFIVIMERVQTLTHLEKPYEGCRDPFYLRCVDVLKKEYAGLDIICDLKPSNIGIRPDGRVVIVDYGYFGGINQMYLGNKII